MEYTYKFGDRVRVDIAAFNDWWDKFNPHGGKMELTEADMPMTATYCPEHQGVVRLENERHTFFCPTVAITSFVRFPAGQKVMVAKMSSSSLDQWLIAIDPRQMLENLEVFLPHEVPIADYRVGETLTIEFVEMTQEEIDVLPEFEGV